MIQPAGGILSDNKNEEANKNNPHSFTFWRTLKVPTRLFFRPGSRFADFRSPGPTPTESENLLFPWKEQKKRSFSVNRSEIGAESRHRSFNSGSRNLFVISSPKSVCPIH